MTEESSDVSAVSGGHQRGPSSWHVRKRDMLPSQVPEFSLANNILRVLLFYLLDESL